MRELARARGLVKGIAAVIALAVPLFLVASPAALAQSEENFTESHLRAAAKLIRVTGSDATFDDILPDIVLKTQNVFTRTNPALTLEIETAVNAAAIEMVPRRLSLAADLQKIWARRFTEAELNELTTFFETPLGAKFVELRTTITVLSVGASRQWQQGISTDMVTRTRQLLQEAGHQL
ncbi:MAG: DUF2059 domain-containing protein [Pseudomonadota bacterium]